VWPPVVIAYGLGVASIVAPFFVFAFVVLAEDESIEWLMFVPFPLIAFLAAIMPRIEAHRDAFGLGLATAILLSALVLISAGELSWIPPAVIPPIVAWVIGRLIGRRWDRRYY
jgi:hypothetical protein